MCALRANGPFHDSSIANSIVVRIRLCPFSHADETETTLATTMTCASAVIAGRSMDSICVARTFVAGTAIAAAAAEIADRRIDRREVTLKLYPNLRRWLAREYSLPLTLTLSPLRGARGPELSRQ